MSAPDVAALLARHPMPWAVDGWRVIDATESQIIFENSIPDTVDVINALATALRAALADQRRWLAVSKRIAGLDFDYATAQDMHASVAIIELPKRQRFKLHADTLADALADIDDAAMTADGGGAAAIGGARIVADETVPPNTVHVIVDGKHVGTITDLDGGGV